MEKPMLPLVVNFVVCVATPNFWAFLHSFVRRRPNFWLCYAVLHVAASKIGFLSVIGSPDDRFFSMYEKKLIKFLTQLLKLSIFLLIEFSLNWLVLESRNPIHLLIVQSVTLFCCLADLFFVCFKL